MLCSINSSAGLLLFLRFGRWDVRKLIEVQDFRTCWADHFNMQKEYYNPPGKPGTVNVLVKLLSRGQAPGSRSDVAGSHIDSLTDRRHGVRASDCNHITPHQNGIEYINDCTVIIYLYFCVPAKPPR